ncbi:MAG TPA: universal stress protein [Myxococcota bacterium]
MKCVLVATDLSPRADEAIRQGDAWAKRKNARLVVAHFVPDIVGVNILFPERSEPQWDMQETLVERARASLIHRVMDLTGRGADELTPVVVDGDPNREIVTVAEEHGADLIVVGDSGAGGLVRALFGRTATKVLRASHVPVLVARPHQPGPTIAATDFSDPAVPALRVGLEHAKATGRRLIFFHAIDYVALPSYNIGAVGAGLGPAPVIATDEMVRAAEKRLAFVARELGAENADLRVGLNGAAATVVNVAEEMQAELVVVGTHGRTGLSRLALGSVAESVVLHSHCSVLVVRLVAS